MGKPILQEGGRQDAMIVALPAFVDPAVPVDVPLAVNAAASEVLQVRFCVIWVLDESVTVAVMFRDPFAKMKEVKLVFSTANDMDNTGQVINCTGGLVTPEVVVKIVVIPGVTAVARAWPGRSPLVVLLTVATFALKLLQLNGPTVDVMSIPWLKAVT